MRLQVLKQFSHFRLGAFVSGEIIEVADDYASHLIEIEVAKQVDSPSETPKIEASTNGNKRTGSRKSSNS